MKLPVNINDSYPLTLGVSDDYFTLSTRLKRLGRPPMQPRRRAAWLLAGALLVSFVAVLPLRLVARAQSEQKATTLSGIVKDQSGAAVANATVYLALRNRAEPLETTDSDADGRYYFTSEIEENRRVVVWADAGTRGIGQAHVSQGASGVRLSNPVVAPRAPVRLLLVAPDGTRAANVRLSVGQMGPQPDEQWVVPLPLAQRLQTQTNARGEAVFAGLPTGHIAHFWLNDQKYHPTQIGFGDLRGDQFAPLSLESAVEVGKAQGWKTIRLVAPVTLRGRVTTPAGVGKSGALVLAQNLGRQSARNVFGVTMTPQARADANGHYTIAGLRPDFYRVAVEAEPWLARSYVSPVEVRELKAPSGRVDLALARGGLIRGVVRHKGSNLPVAGQHISLFDQKRNYQVTQTDARGAFMFRANAGQALVWAQNGGGTDGKPPAQILGATLKFTAFEMKQYSGTQDNFRVATLMTGGDITISSRNYRPGGGEVKFSASQLALVPVQADATRDITLELSPPPTKATKKIKRSGPATLSGKVSLPKGPGIGATIMLRPANSDDRKDVIIEESNSDGVYQIKGLQPGRYRISANLDDVTKANWAAPKITHTLNAGANRADIQLSRGALITGTVISRVGKQPLKDIEVLTADTDGDGTIVKTDARGKFQFRVAPGRVAVRLHQHPEDVTIHVYDRGATPRSFILSQNAPWMFNLKDGDTRKLQFESPQTSSKPTNAATAKGNAKNRAITGTVIGPDGKPVAGAEVAGRALEFGAKGWNGPLVTDANGRFSLYERSANLFARKGDLTTARGTYAFVGDDVTLQIEPDVYAQVEGQITDRATKRPVAGAKIWYSATGHMDYPRQVTTMLSDAQGRFRFDKLRPFQSHYFSVSKNGYGRESVGTFVLQKGETKVAPVALKPLNQTLSGRITLANGQAAGAGLLVRASTINPRDDSQETRTRADGSFFFPNVPDEKLQISVDPPGAGEYWEGFWTRGGRSGVTFGLTDARLHRVDKAKNARIIAQRNALRKSWPALIGKPAPTGTIIGTARDEGGKPLAGIEIWAYAPELYQFNGPTTVTTKADGKYRIEKFPTGGKFAVIALPGKGYSTLPEPGDNVWGLDYRSLKAGQTLVVNIRMRAAPATLAGTVLKSDGSLMVGYHVSPRNMKRTSVSTKANGKFWLAGVWSGPRDVYVYDLMSRKRWGPYRAADNQRDLVLRLSEKTRDKNYVLGQTQN